MGVENRKQTEQHGQSQDIFKRIAPRTENSSGWVDLDKFNSILDGLDISRYNSKGGRPQTRFPMIRNIFRNRANDWTSLTEIAENMFPDNTNARKYTSNMIWALSHALQPHGFEVETVAIRSSESKETYYRIRNLSPEGDK